MGYIIAIASLAVMAIMIWFGLRHWARSRRAAPGSLRGVLAGMLPPADAERLEDVLKYLSAPDREGESVTLDGLAGRLGVSGDKAAELLSQLGREGLVQAQDDGYRITELGRERGVRLLRAHRLYERYLADRTGVHPDEWHTRAERMEHQLDEAEAEALAARLGHPRFDPHGDPIPTAAGDLPEPSGLPLTRLGPGSAGTVTHVEDEPVAVYRGLLAAGIAPGVRVEVQSRDPEGIRIRADGRDVTLAQVEAGNVTVEPLPPGTRMGPPRATLADARPGETVRVAGISASCQGPQRRRLLDLGLVPGTEVVAELVSTSGDPVAYRIRGALIALRRAQASAIEVELARTAEPASAPAATQGEDS